MHVVIEDIYKVEYRFHFVDNPIGNIKDVFYVSEFSDKRELVDIIEKHLLETDKSKIFNSIVDITYFPSRYLKVNKEIDMTEHDKFVLGIKNKWEKRNENSTTKF